MESRDRKTSNEDDSSEISELNVGSDRFNPLRALYEPNFRVTDAVPKVIYQNLAAFESALKNFGIWQLNKRQKPDPQKEEIRDIEKGFHFRGCRYSTS